MTARFSSRILPAFLISIGLCALGCGGRDDDPGDAGALVDAGPGIDGGPRDAALGDAGEDDASQDSGIAPVDSGDDAGGDPDASTGEDAGRQLDACVPPVCPAPPAGCGYVGGSPCECGTIVCEPAGDCGGACGAGEYCNLCVTPDPACATRPADMGRICPGVYMPVCGCDGRTYGNGCQLGSAGIGLLYEGECGSTG